MSEPPLYFLVRLTEAKDYKLRADIMEFFCARGISSLILSSDVIYGEEAVRARRCGCHKGDRSSKCLDCERRASVARVDYGIQTESVTMGENALSTNNNDNNHLLDLDVDVKPEPIEIPPQPLPLFDEPSTSFELDVKPRQPHPLECLEEMPDEDVEEMHSQAAARLTFAPPAKKSRSTPLSAVCKKCCRRIDMFKSSVNFLEHHVVYDCKYKESPGVLAMASSYFACTVCDYKGLTEEDVKQHADAEHGRHNTRRGCRDYYQELGRGEEYIKARCLLLALLIEHFPSVAIECREFYENAYRIPILHAGSVPVSKIANMIRNWTAVSKPVESAARVGLPRSASVESTSSGGGKDEVVECKLCHRQLSDRCFSIMYHLRQYHIDMPDRFRCPRCDHSAMRLSSMRIHMRHEHGQLPTKMDPPKEMWTAEMKSSLYAVASSAFPRVAIDIDDEEDKKREGTKRNAPPPAPPKPTTPRIDSIDTVECKKCGVPLACSVYYLQKHVVDAHLPDHTPRYKCHADKSNCNKYCYNVHHMAEHLKDRHHVGDFAARPDAYMRDLWTDAMISCFVSVSRECLSEYASLWAEEDEWTVEAEE